MKLRYYLRGLGIGMLVAALILTLSGGEKGKMSDAAIKSRAAELGMVEKDKTVLGQIGSEETVSGNGEAVKQEPPSNAQAATPETAQKKEETATVPEKKPQEAAQNLANATNKQESETPAAPNNTQTLPEKIEERANEVAQMAAETAENAPQGEVVTFMVSRGDSSVSIAKKAKELGLVTSVEAFDDFLCSNGYDRRISIGQYEIVKGASERDIADIITKSR